MIDTKALRDKIMDLAMKGKLIPQDPNDEPASVLLEKIKIEKELLIAEGTIKKEKVLAPIRDEEIPFDIPENWEWVRLKEVLKPQINSKPKGDSFIYVDISAVDNKSNKIVEVPMINVKNAPSRAIKLIEKDDVLFSMVRPYLKNIAFVSEKFDKTICSSGFYVMKSNSKGIFSKYLFYLTLSKYIVQGLMKFMKGDNSPSVNKTDIDNFIIPLPPINEQKRMVTKIEELFSLIDTIENESIAYKAIAKQLENKVLDLAMQGRLVEPNPEDEPANELLNRSIAENANMNKRDNDTTIIFRNDDGLICEKSQKGTIRNIVLPFKFPEWWEVQRFSTLISLVRGSSPRPIKQYVTDSKDGVNWIKIGDTKKDEKYIESTNEKITVEGSKKSRGVNSGDFILSNSMSFGRPYILKIDGYIHDGWFALRKFEFAYDSNFLYWLISSKLVMMQFSTNATGSTVKNINSDIVNATFMPLPPLNEQKRIVKKIEEIFQVINS